MLELRSLELPNAVVAQGQSQGLDQTRGPRGKLKTPTYSWGPDGCACAQRWAHAQGGLGREGPSHPPWLTVRPCTSTTEHKADA